MRKYVLILLAILAAAIAVSGCTSKKSETKVVEPPAKEAPAKEPTKETEKATTTKPEQPKAAPKAKQGGYKVTASGLKIKDIKEGQGAEVKKGDTVVVNYKGWLDDGTVFDTSKKPGREPFDFTVGAGEVIKGWDEGLQGMKVGGVRELVIPSDMGYGSRAVGPIPANSTLHFEIELLKIAG